MSTFGKLLHTTFHIPPFAFLQKTSYLGRSPLGLFLVWLRPVGGVRLGPTIKRPRSATFTSKYRTEKDVKLCPLFIQTTPAQARNSAGDFHLGFCRVFLIAQSANGLRVRRKIWKISNSWPEKAENSGFGLNCATLPFASPPSAFSRKRRFWRDCRSDFFF